MKKYLLPLILILLLTLTLGGYSAWLAGWDYRIEITLPDYAGDIGASVTWFPVDVFLTATQAEEVFTELTTDAEYKKTQFTQSDGTSLLYGHKILFDVSETKGIFRVSATGWTINANTSIFLYYDKDHAPNTDYIGVTGTAAAEAVYNAEYIAVYTMDDAPAFSDWTEQYEGNVEPDSDGWTLVGTDYSTSDGDILTIDTTGDSTAQTYYYKTPNIDFDAGFYFKIRVQMHTDSPVNGSLAVAINDGTQNERTRFYIFDTLIRQYNSVGGFTNYPKDTTSTYHTYEMYVKGTTAKLYMDGVLLGTETVESSSVTDIVSFGDSTSSVDLSIECMIDYVYYALGVTDNPLNLIIPDSTSNNNHGTKKGVGEPVEATGKVGQAQDFDGDDDYISAPVATTDWTLEAIVKSDVADGLVHYIISWDSAAAGFFYDGTHALYDNYFGIYDGTNTVKNIDITQGNDEYIAATKSGTSYEIFLNGVSKASGTLDAMTISSIALGRRDDNFWYYGGIMDEVRISSLVRSDEWLLGTKNTLWDTLFTYGSQESAPAVGITWNGIVITKWNGVTITIPINTQ